MIIIQTNTGGALDQTDSQEYVKWRITQIFESFEAFMACKEIKHHSFWGECHLMKPEAEYQEWIQRIAQSILH